MRNIPGGKFADRLRPPCSGCGRSLLLARIEPEEPGFDLGSPHRTAPPLKQLCPEIAAAEPAEKNTNLEWDRLSWRAPFFAAAGS